MSNSDPSIERQSPVTSADSPSNSRVKTQRVLACVLCQHRKVKCDRKFPCANCLKSRVQCVPATLTQRQRRRRFPERELLERLRRYEDILRQHNIPFQPLHKDDSGGDKPANQAESVHDSEEEQDDPPRPSVSTPATTVRSTSDYEAKSILQTMRHGFRDAGEEDQSSDEDIPEKLVKKAWNEVVETGENFLFGSRTTSIDLSTLHPEPAQLFRLWQIYLDNVNPLLKVTHTPTLQGAIIEAAGHLTSLEPNLEALMFSIYCTAVHTLSPEDCQTIFNSPRDDLMTRYHFGCQQALLNAGFLRTGDRTCLTALLLYLMSIRHGTVAQSLSSMCGVAVRIAQRMGIHTEATLSKLPPLEAEMCRRLWWVLILFDARVSETCSMKGTTLDPTWDCKIPLNINDSELRPEMKTLPEIHTKISESVFIVMRCETGDFIRHSLFYLDFTSPALKPVALAKNPHAESDGNNLDRLETLIEDRFVRFCDQDNSLHFTTTWMARAQLAKLRLLEYHAKYSEAPTRPTEEMRDLATSHAIRWLECDTTVMTSPLSKGLRWLNRFYFPFLAYVHILQDVKRRPASEPARRAWETMSVNFKPWPDRELHQHSPFLNVFATLIIQAWQAYATASEQLGEFCAAPSIVTTVKQIQEQRAQKALPADSAQPALFMDLEFDDFPMPLPYPMNFGNQNLSPTSGLLNSPPIMPQATFGGMTAPSPATAQMNQWNWAAGVTWPMWQRF